MEYKNKTLVKSVVIALTLSISGCASIVGKSAYPVVIKSTPDGTHFVIKNAEGNPIHTGETPATVTLSSGKGYFKKANYTVVFSKEGYNEQTIPLNAGLSGWYFGNILLGGLIGMLIVDPATGAMWKLPDDVAGNLTKPDVAINIENGLTPQLQVVALDQIADELRPQLIKLN